MINKADLANMMAEFESKVLAHPILKNVRSELLDQIHAPAGQPISAVVGPTGTGKTTLGSNIRKEILLEEADRMQAEPGYIPIVRVEAPAPEMGRTAWGDFHKRTLIQLDEPLIDRKGADVFEPGQQKIRRGQSIADLRRAVENCMRYRKTRVFLIDEAQHLTRVPHARHMMDQMETIKSMASLSGVRIVLIGTYELLDLLSLNGQLARRTGVIHFPRYRYDVSEELKAFRNILSMFQSRLPLPCVPSLADQAETIYLGTLGCVGLVKDWLSRTLWRALSEGVDQLKSADLKATAYHASSLKKIADEIQQGESRLENEADSERNLRLLLGMPGELRRETVSKPILRHSSPVGQRAPVRDKVGV